MAQEIDKLIDLSLLDALFDEWMSYAYWNAQLSGTNITVTDKWGNAVTTDLAAAAKAAKADWDNTYKPQMDNDHTRAESDHTASVTATNEASNVNAQLAGMTVTITNRQGQSTSVNIGFEIYRTYGSIAAMNADAANVPAGKFVMIATTDPTSTENAQLYARNSSAATSANPFTFLSDLDQASSSAWADWLNNMKPLIEADHQQAGTDHQTAVSDHSTASSDHSTATDDHTASVTATSAANTEAERAKDYNDHPWEIRNDGYIWVWDEDTEQMVQTNKMIVSWNDLTAAQQQAIIDAMVQDIMFASVATCESIIDELT